jgi:hypothetical protein
LKKGRIMKKRFTKRELYELRNFVPVNDWIRELGVPCKFDEDGRFRFLCPVCGEFFTSTKADTNLARCFRCERNFNTIDLAMVCRRVGFVEAAESLKAFLSNAGRGGGSSEGLSG